MSLNLAYYLEHMSKTHASAPAMRQDGLCLSFGEFASGARKVANILVSHGIRRGHKVAMMLPNVPEFSMIYYGILYVGATVVPINNMLKSHEIQYQLEDADVELFFAWDAYESEARKAFRASEPCVHFVVVSECHVTPASDIDYRNGEGFANLFAAASDEFDMFQTMPEDTAAILYTSGTTGSPKGAELTHFNLFFNALYTRDHLVKPQEGDLGLVILPLFHSFGQTCMMNLSVLSGMPLFLMSSFDTEKTMEIIEREKVTFIAAVPTMYYWMLNSPPDIRYDLSSLRLALSGGSALSVNVYDRFKERFGVGILEGYGLTETSPVASFNLPGKALKIGSIGKPIWGCEMAIKRSDGSFANVDEVGEIVIRGHNIMKGYYKKPVTTEAVFVDGWFHTGDLGKYDDEGYFYLVDRIKDIIIRSGMNIYPCEIEEALYGHPDVLEACVVGVPDEARGEEVKAFVVCRSSVSPPDLRNYCLERLARYKVPREFVFVPSLPKGPTGKVLKREILDGNL